MCLGYIFFASFIIKETFSYSLSNAPITTKLTADLYTKTVDLTLDLHWEWMKQFHRNIVIYFSKHSYKPDFFFVPNGNSIKKKTNIVAWLAERHLHEDLIWKDINYFILVTNLLHVLFVKNRSVKMVTLPNTCSLIPRRHYISAPPVERVSSINMFWQFICWLIPMRWHMNALFVGEHSNINLVWKYIWEFIEMSDLLCVLCVTNHLIRKVTLPPTY